MNEIPTSTGLPDWHDTATPLDRLTANRRARFRFLRTIWWYGRKHVNAWAGAAVIVLSLAMAQNAIRLNEARTALAEVTQQRDDYRAADVAREVDAARLRCHRGKDKGVEWTWCVTKPRRES